MPDTPTETTETTEITATDTAVATTVRKPPCNRCSACNKKVNLLGVRCRCKGLYCGQHIHDHACTYDFKASQRDLLRRENPIVVPSKLEGM